MGRQFRIAEDTIPYMPITQPTRRVTNFQADVLVPLGVAIGSGVVTWLAASAVCLVQSWPLSVPVWGGAVVATVCQAWQVYATTQERRGETVTVTAEGEVVNPTYTMTIVINHRDGRVQTFPNIDLPAGVTHDDLVRVAKARPVWSSTGIKDAARVSNPKATAILKWFIARGWLTENSGGKTDPKGYAVTEDGVKGFEELANYQVGG
jgi:hypothetical protein